MILPNMESEPFLCSYNTKLKVPSGSIGNQKEEGKRNTDIAEHRFQEALEIHRGANEWRLIVWGIHTEEMT